MKNLSKKIGVGVVASSLVVGGAVSTRLVANAESSIEQSYTQVDLTSDRSRKLEQIGDLETIKFAEENYGFEVFGYYFIDSSYDKHKMDNDTKELLEWIKNKDESLEGKYKNILTKDPEFNFKYGKEFIEYIYINGMNKGVKKIRIGDAVGIFVFKDKIEPNKKDWYDSIDKWINDNLLDKQRNRIVCNVQVDDIEGTTHVNILNHILEIEKN